ncbi:MAG TPA: ABC transporter permease subunit [Clostridiaceae bacterium]|nr:ABC transporter permease subunit [Clostridiaceae bacterium]
MEHFTRFIKYTGFWTMLRNTLSITLYNLATFPIPVIVALLINEIRSKWFKKTVNQKSTVNTRTNKRRINVDAIFDICNTIFMLIFLFIMLYPLYFTIIASISDINEVGNGNVYLLPKGFTLEAYKNVFINKQIWIGYKNTIIYTFFGTLYGLIILLPTAYALSKKNIFGRKVITWYFLITMYFSGGMVPTYLLIKNLGLLNNPLVMIVGPMSIYNLIVTKSYFATSIPNELYESANIDGANTFTCFFRIAIPLAKPIIAVMALYISVAIWNSYFIEAMG